MMSQIVTDVLGFIHPVFFVLSVYLFRKCKAIAYNAGHSMVGLSRLATHNYVKVLLLKRSPELSLTATGFVYLVLSPIRKMQLSPNEKE